MAKKKRSDGENTIAVNRRARHDYHIEGTLEAGLALSGTEVKSLRAGKASLKEAFATVKDGEAWLLQAHIPEYSHGGYTNHDPTRPRKLLLHRDEIAACARFIQEQGRTLAPLKLYWKNGKAKLLLGLASGKRKHDKRRDLARRDAQRQIERSLKARQHA